MQEAHGIVFRASQAAIRKFLLAIGGEQATVDSSPPGWSDDELLAEAMRITGTSMLIE